MRAVIIPAAVVPVTVTDYSREEQSKSDVQLQSIFHYRVHCLANNIFMLLLLADHFAHT